MAFAPQTYGSFNFSPQCSPPPASHDQARREAELAQKEREVAARERKFEEQRALLLCCDYEALRQLGRPNWRQAPAQWHAFGSRLFLCWVLTTAVFALNFLVEVGLDFASMNALAAGAAALADDTNDMFASSDATASGGALGGSSSTAAAAAALGGGGGVVDTMSSHVSAGAAAAAAPAAGALGGDSTSSSMGNLATNSSSGVGFRGAVPPAGALSQVVATTVDAISRSLNAVDEFNAGNGREQTVLGGQSGMATLLLLGAPVVAWLGWAHPLSEAALVDGTSDKAGRAALVVLAAHGLFCAFAAIAPPGCGLAGFTVAFHAARVGWKLPPPPPPSQAQASQRSPSAAWRCTDGPDALTSSSGLNTARRTWAGDCTQPASAKWVARSTVASRAARVAHRTRPCGRGGRIPRDVP